MYGGRAAGVKSNSLSLWERVRVRALIGVAAGG
jgi:hypothetical protein